jgi:5-methylcytosine-specific restriction endonuclease McrA
MKRAPLPKISGRRIRRDRHYPKQRRKVFDRADGRCEVSGSIQCTRRFEQVHHRAGRNGPDPHRLDNLVGVCQPCHMLIHAMPELAYRNGWSVRRNTTT